MQTTEAPFVVSHNFCAVRGNSVGELMDNLREFNAHDDVEAEILVFRSKVTNHPHQGAVNSVHQELGGTVLVEPAATPVAAAPAGTPEVIAGKYGDKWTYGLAEAPALPDGRGFYALREWTDAKQVARIAFVDPSKGPKPFSPGAVEAKIIWK